MENYTINDTIFDFVYQMAMNDATRRTDANKGGEKSPANMAKNCVPLRKEVKKYAEKVINGEKPEFKNCAENCETILKDNEIDGFLFGNLQKLINMTMKYLFIRFYDDESIRKNFEICDAPMDMQMKEIVRKYIAKKKKNNEEYRELPKLGVNWAWSLMKHGERNENYMVENYSTYQNAIQKLIEINGNTCNKIEFDYLNWGKTKDEDLEFVFKK